MEKIFLKYIVPFILHPIFLDVACGIIIVIFICGWFCVSNKPNSNFPAHCSSWLVSLGITFTFLGIAAALVSFDTVNRDISKLLGSLKFAFITSAVGLALSIVFKFISFRFPKQAISEEVSAKDIHSSLEKINQSTLEVKKAIDGDGETSLFTQIGNLRNDFRDFAREVKQEGSKALIEALKEVIQDFNAKIGEQFGENFQHLNQAIENLLEWQKEYKLQITELIEQFKENQQGIQKVEESIENIEQSTSNIPSYLDSINEVFQKTNARVEELYSGLSSLAEIKKQAEELIPEIKSNFLDLTKEFNNYITLQLEKIENIHNSFSSKNETILENINKEVENSTNSINKIQLSISNDLKKSVEETQGILNDSIQKLDKSMQEEIERALKGMGNNLVSISGQFIKDYESSIKEMHKSLKKVNKTN